MTEKKYITGADVLRALADGKKVRPAYGWGPRDYLVLRRGVEYNSGASYTQGFTGHWEIVEEPATDAELVAEMRKRGLEAHPTADSAQAAYNDCADMLESRRIK